MKVLLLLFFCVLSLCLNAQFNLDSKKIKKKGIKSMVFSNVAKCEFDEQGRLTKYIQGEISENEEPSGDYEVYSVDTLGNFYHFVKYVVFRGKPDTLCVWTSEFNGQNLISSSYWEKTGWREVGYGQYQSQSYGDTVFEYLMRFSVEDKLDTNHFRIRANVTVNVSPTKKATHLFSMNGKNASVDSVRREFYSINRDAWNVSEFDENGVVRKEYRLSKSNGITWLCSYRRSGQDRQKQVYTSSQGKRVREVPITYYEAFEDNMRFEQHDEFCVNPSKFLKSSEVTFEVEYF